MMLPLLKFAKDGKVHSLNEAEDYLFKHFKLTEEEKKKLKPSGGETTFLNRLRWARTFLNKAGLLKDPKRGFFQITSRGMEVIKQNPSKINTKFLHKFNEFVEWKKMSRVDSVIKIEQSPQKKIPEKYGAVILLDALGTKGVWKNNDTDVILERWNTFTGLFEDLFENYMKEYKAEVTFTAFSDTIIITVVSADIEVSLLHIAAALISPFIIGLVLGVYLRGCISIGKFFGTDKIVIGSAIDEAAQYYTLPEWIGISASPSTYVLLEKLKDKKIKYFENLFYKYDIPLKNIVERNGWALNWPGPLDEYVQQLSTTFQINPPFSSIEEIINKQLAGNSADISTSLKWRNTWNFYDEITKKMYSKKSN